MKKRKLVWGNLKFGWKWWVKTFENVVKLKEIEKTEENLEVLKKISEKIKEKKAIAENSELGWKKKEKNSRKYGKTERN